MAHWLGTLAAPLHAAQRPAAPLRAAQRPTALLRTPSARAFAQPSAHGASPRAHAHPAQHTGRGSSAAACPSREPEIAFSLSRTRIFPSLTQPNHQESPNNHHNYLI